MPMKVPFLDIAAGNEALRAEINAAIQEVIDTSAFAGGPFVARFEQEFAAFCDCPHCVGVGSGTDALWLALLGLGIGSGDEVITAPNSFMATAEAITYSGATPVFADVDPCTYTMDPAQLDAAITPKTKAIVPVHLFGQPADMDPILEVARFHGLPVIEDACQAHGAEYKGRRAGSLGDAACFSFYPGKNLGAFGEAGAVVTSNQELVDKMRVLRDHGQVRKYHHSMIGWNCRMDGIQAALLSVKLRHLEDGNRCRRAHAAYYDHRLGGMGRVERPLQASYSRHVYHIYAIRTPRREEFIAYLAQREIGSGIHYPVTIHRQEAYRGLGYGEGSFPVAERCAGEFVSLPMFPELTTAQLQAVCEVVSEAVAALA